MNDKDRDELMLKSILEGGEAVLGPEIVQFDITNRCNNDCICCWNNSPLLEEPTPEKKKNNECELPFGIIKRAIFELKEMGTKTLFLAGGGEPFMHPDVIEILKCAKENGMKVCLNTNFALVDRASAKEIVDAKVDLIHVSLLAGTPETYALVHPNKSRETFLKIKETLAYLLQYRREKKQETPVPLPHIDLYYVIFNKNYGDIGKMADLAMELRTNTLEFTPVDVLPGTTDVLLLNEAQKAFVLREVKMQHKRIEEFNKREGSKVTFIEQYDSFLKRLSPKEATQGRYETRIVLNQPCYVGWSFLRILADGSVIPCLKAHRIPSGNLYQHSIKDIWNNEAQQLFRKKSLALDSEDPYFKMIGNDPSASFGCINSCDNIQVNIDMHNKFADLLRSHGRIK
ncbi:MAG: radical SAM protein [Candidatus Omnitrophota bacterium]